MLSHAVEGFVDLTDYGNDAVLSRYKINTFYLVTRFLISFFSSSEYNKSPIRINIYPTHSNERLVTANCARIKKSNILAENGILHETESVVVPATEDVQSIMKNHPQLTHFSKGNYNLNIGVSQGSILRLFL